MRLGVYGGTFDPIHYGHLLLAEQCREQCELDEVWFVPARQPPHKTGVSITSPAARVDMLELALAGCPEFIVSPLELERDGPSYTVDTLTHLVEEDPSRELFLLIGGDSLADLPTWRQPDRILELATVVAVNRGPVEQSDFGTAAETIAKKADERIRYVEMPGLDISASDIRGRVRSNRSIRFLTPRPVAMYIAQHDLYQPSAAVAASAE